MLEGKNVELCRSHGAVLFECVADQNVQGLRPAEVGSYQSGLARDRAWGLRGATFSIFIASYVAGVTLESRFASGARGVLGTGFWRRLTQPEIPSRKVAVKSKGHRRVIAGLIMGTKKLLRAYQQRDRQRRFQ